MKSESRKDGFTLIELLIATVIIVTLMGIVFRLAGVGGDSRKKAETIERIQRVENALSGYFAAYGSYPPVPLQGRSRSIYKKVDDCGVQELGSSESGQKGNLDWDRMKNQILAACKAQPVAVNWPFNKEGDQEMVQNLSSLRVQNGANKRSFDVIRNVGGLDLDKSDWRECAVFKFGLLSFLMPRYFFMLEGDEELYDHVNSKTGRRCGQWASNNQLPCRMDTGERFESWEDLQKALHAGDYYRNGGSSLEASMISNLTSQSVCARWMPNFEGIVSGGKTFFGVKTADTRRPYLTANGDYVVAVHSPNGFSEGGGGSLYGLNGMTIYDGWSQELFYYSEPPYSSYKLWSAGANGQTFPPWYDRGQLSGNDLTTVEEWTSDDISGLNN